MQKQPRPMQQYHDENLPAPPVSFLEAVRRGFTVWAWRGRASRSEFWYWAAAVGGMYAIYFLLTLLLAPETIDNGVAPWLVGAVSLLGILKVAPRRLRDANESPYQVVVILLSLLGAYILTISMLVMLFALAWGGGVGEDAATVLLCVMTLPLVLWAAAWARRLSKPGSRETSHHDTPRKFFSLRNPVFRIVLFGLLALAYLLFRGYRPF